MAVHQNAVILKDEMSGGFIHFFSVFSIFHIPLKNRKIKLFF